MANKRTRRIPAPATSNPPAHNPTERHAHHGKHHLHCHHCGKAFRHQPAVGLFCSLRCEKQYAADRAKAGQQLGAKGFTVNKKAPNVFTKDGVSITLEQVKVHGLKETLNLHAAAAKVQ